ncbi:MAG: ABC transporter ATP-binding protein [Planctomycetota bacterium]|nr:MAG: ABC transporter ATP-binding protein [Planctomycetota bacterium]
MDVAPAAAPPSNGPQPRSPLLAIRDLTVSFRIEDHSVTAVEDVSFDVYPGEVLGIVGESGSGKSVTAMSILRLIPDPPGHIDRGSVMLEGVGDLMSLPHDQLRQVRGRHISMIFQEPMTALNPVFTVGMQLTEAYRAHFPVRRREAIERAVEFLSLVGISDARKRMRDYPHQFSGGMRQRVMIAMALICEPRLVIADEPTTALDVTTQAEILELMLELKNRTASNAIMLITHDLAVVAETCDRVLVMYGGRVQEVGSVRQIFHDPKHPYTVGLLRSLPSLAPRGQRLYAIPGNVPSIEEMPDGCKFCTRCDEVMDICRTVEPPLIPLSDGRLVRCHLYQTPAAPPQHAHSQVDEAVVADDHRPSPGDSPRSRSNAPTRATSDEPATTGRADESPRDGGP